MATPAAGTDAGARRSGRGGDVLRGERRVVADRLAKRRGTVKFRPEKEEESMAASSSPDRRRRVACGVYEQPNAKYAVCVRVDGRARFRTLEAATLVEALRQREVLQRAGRLGELPLSPRLTFAEVAGRWLAEFEAK